MGEITSTVSYIPASRIYPTIEVNVEVVEGEFSYVYLVQASGVADALQHHWGDVHLIRIHKDQARMLIEVLQRALELENKGNDMVEVGVYGLCCPNRP